RTFLSASDPEITGLVHIYVEDGVGGNRQHAGRWTGHGIDAGYVRRKRLHLAVNVLGEGAAGYPSREGHGVYAAERHMHLRRDGRSRSDLTQRHGKRSYRHKSSHSPTSFPMRGRPWAPYGREATPIDRVVNRAPPRPKLY